MNKPTDRELLIAAADGKESAMTELYQRYAGRLKTYATGALGGDVAADDVVQQVFIQLIESKAFRQPHGGPEKLDHLLFTMAKNLIRNELRSSGRRERRETIYSYQLDITEPAVEVPVTDLDALACHLPDHQRQALLLRFRHGLEVAAIAQLLDCPAGTVKSRLHYGLKRLAQLLQPQRADDNNDRS